MNQKENQQRKKQKNTEQQRDGHWVFDIGLQRGEEGLQVFLKCVKKTLADYNIDPRTKKIKTKRSEK